MVTPAPATGDAPATTTIRLVPAVAPDPAADGTGRRVLGVIDAGGGAAGTSVAHAVADALATPARPALLLDAGGDGDRAIGRLGLTRPGGGLAALAVAGPPGGPDWEHAFDAELRPAGPALQVLPGLARPSEAALVTEACVVAALDAARRRAVWIVVDLGRWSPQAWRRTARLTCDDWLLVVAPTGPGVQAARAILRELADEAPGRTGRLVLNRAGGPAAFPAAEITAHLGWPVAAILPDDPAAAALAVARQVPLTRVPGPLGVAVRQLADALRAAAEPVSSGARASGRRTARSPRPAAGTPARLAAVARSLVAPFRRLAGPAVPPSSPPEVLHDAP